MILDKLLRNLSDWKHTRAWKKQFHIVQNVHEIENQFKNISGFDISRQARLNQPSLELTYGEINLESFLAILSLAKPKPHQHFYDLGCGLGKTVWAAAKTYPFRSCNGVEKIEALFQMSLQQKKLFMNPFNTPVKFFNQDILDTHWQESSILFLNVASFVPESWKVIAQKMMNEPSDCIITLAKCIPHERFNIQSTHVMTSWGIVRAYVHDRIDKN